MHEREIHAGAFKQAVWRQAIALFFSATAVACAQTARVQDDNRVLDPLDVELGKMIAETHCSSCHAIGRSDESSHPEALALRDLSNLYPVEYLEEAFAEGVSVGHRDMPAWRFRPAQIEQLLAYLNSIQDTPSHTPIPKDKPQ